MFDTIYSWITTCLQFALDTFVMLLDETGTGSFYLSGMFMIAIFGFVLSPFIRRSFAGSGSDQVKKREYKETKGDSHS